MSDENPQIARLVEQLAEVEAALVDATAGTIDAVVDPRGHLHLLRGAQQALLESEARAKRDAALLDAVLRSAPDFITCITPDDTIEWLNRPEEIPGRRAGAHWLSGLAPELRPPLEGVLAEVRQSGDTAVHEGPGPGPDGTQRWYSRHLGPVLHDGAVAGVVVVTRDVTEAKAAFDEVRRLNESLDRMVEARTAELQAVNRELDEFSHSVAHDLRAPLRAIEGFGSAILEEAALAGPSLHHLELVVASARRMSTLIDALLTMSRSTRTPMRRSHVDLTRTAHRIVDALRNREPARDVVVGIDEGLSALGDEDLLEIALENLLSNAWKYTRKRDGARIRVELASSDPVPTFAVSDNGAGFDMKYAAKLFGTFQRLHSEAEFEGIGLGLATVQRIVARHGGRVWAQAIVGEGATFWFTLSAAPKEPDPAP